ncbi:MAG: hypothetical protein AAF744_10110 [Pseudomonadota bacterium]
MRWSMIAVAVLALAACGADGEPIQPVAQSAISLSTSGVGLGTQFAVPGIPLQVSLGTQL